MSGDHEKYLKSVVEVGKTISIEITITDYENALRLMSTMHTNKSEGFGVIVQSWGFHNSIKAEEKRLELLKAQIEENTNKLNDIFYIGSAELLESEK